MKTSIAVLAFLLLCGCGTTNIARYGAREGEAPPKQKVVVVIDGTSNNPHHRTNAARIYELISNRNRSNLAVFYTEGVGSRGRFVGLATAWGMAKDVRDAYRFIAESWQPGGDIYLFGFSRGAFGGRILSGLIRTAGIINLRPGHTTLSPEQRARLIDRVYDAYKEPTRPNGSARIPRPTPDDRMRAVAVVLAQAGIEPVRDVRIKAAGYWDTVGAMGLPDGDVLPFTEESVRYLDQFCNVDHVFHAMSLDDNRAKDFTPLLATSKPKVDCGPGGLQPQIDETWFSGAHADVGGTYSDELALQGQLPGISLNWMIARLAELDPELLPPGAGQYDNPYDMIHDARRKLMIWRLRTPLFRDVMAWPGDPLSTQGQLRIHHSVEQRLAKLFDIDKSFSAQCAAQGRKKPWLICAAELEANGFLRAAKDAACVRSATTIDPLTGRKRHGYVFTAAPEKISGRPEVDRGCVTIVYNTIAERDAHFAAQEKAASASSAP